MFKKMALLTVAILFSGTSNAGLFDSNDFKCGRDDAVKALADYIKNDALGMLQRDFITKSRFNYYKPDLVYQDKLNSVEMTISNVSTANEKSYGLNCNATITLKIPQDTLDVVSKYPNYLQYITGGHGKINNSGVTWNDVTYRAKLADNNKDIVFNDFSRTDASNSMFNISVLAINKEQIINALSKNTLNSAQSAYAIADRELNAIWKGLPDSVRNAMKKEQIAWVNSKVARCGKISDGKSETIDLQQRISVYQCQTEMTNERVSYLTGDDE